MTMPADGTPIPGIDTSSTDGVEPPTGTEDDFAQFLSSLEGTGFEYPATLSSVLNQGGTNDDPELDDNPPGDNPPEPPVVTPPGSTPVQGQGTQADVVRIGDKDVPLAEVQQLYELGLAIRQGGLTTTLVPPVEQPTPTTTPPPPAPTPPAIPDFIDQEDPVQMGLWTKLQEVEGKLDQQSNQSQAITQQFARQMGEQYLHSALTSFRESYPTITDEDLALIRPHAAQLLPAVQTTTQEPIAAMKRALYIAALEIPGTQQKIIAPDAQTTQQKSTQRKQKISSLGGSSGSGARTSPRPNLSTDKSMVDELAQAINDAYSTNGRLN